MPEAFFEQNVCECGGGSWPAWQTIADKIYCMCVQERPDRREESAKNFHKAGLCSLVTYYRPPKDPAGARAGSWEAHREITKRAIQEGCRRVLIFEDDVCFSEKDTTPTTVALVSHKMSQLRKPWDLFFLGHFPIAPCYPVTLDFSIWRVRSLMIHAYVLNLQGSWAKWVCENGPAQNLRFLDAYAFAQAKAYACFPMFVFQTNSPSTHDRRNEGLWKRMINYCIEQCEQTAPIAEKVCYNLFFLICWILFFRVCCLSQKAILQFGSGR